MRNKSLLSKLIILMLTLMMISGCSFGSKDKSETDNNKTTNVTETVEDRVREMSNNFNVVLEDYSSYYKDKNITKCLMATTENIMYSFTEFDSEENAEKAFDDGMSSQKDKVTIENNNDTYHLYELQQTLKTSTVENKTTIDKVVNSKDKDAVNVKYTTYNIREGKAIVSIMAKTDNSKDLSKALEIMGYKTK